MESLELVVQEMCVRQVVLYKTLYVTRIRNDWVFEIQASDCCDAHKPRGANKRGSDQLHRKLGLIKISNRRQGLWEFSWPKSLKLNLCPRTLAKLMLKASAYRRCNEYAGLIQVTLFPRAN